MQPNTVSKTDWIPKVPLTKDGTIDVVALELSARHARARVIGGFLAGLFGAGKRRAQTKDAQPKLDRAALA